MGFHNKAPIWADRYHLSAREVEVVILIVAGLTNKEIARQCGISPRTVEVHREHVRLKMSARNTADIVRTIFLEEQGASE